MQRLSSICLLSLSVVLLACGSDLNQPSPSNGASAHSAFAKTVANPPAERPEGWDDYWYSGLAELNTYTLTQNRYGEDRPGDAVLVFVTEPFLPETQVKDDGVNGGEEAISVLKLNRIHRFNTGIYDYSLMLSAFTPVSRNQYPHTLKTTLSAQDWCGHSWFQLNRRGDKFQAERRSYFQREADAKSSINAELIEDELPALVRLDPTNVPTGKVQLVPGAMFSALFHIMPEAQEAVLSFGESPSAGDEMRLEIDYPKLQRSLTYRFSERFPHRLLGWREMYQGKVISSAALKHSRQEPYWSQNGVRFDGLRDTLGLPRI